jgi:hypothetical protein
VTVPLITLQRLGFEQSLLGRMLGLRDDRAGRRRGAAAAALRAPSRATRNRLILQLGQRVRR